MRLTADQSYALLERFGCYVKDVCDKCGAILGPVRYTRSGELGEWCSRECRGDADRPVIRKGGRPRKYRTPEEGRAAKTAQQRVYRNVLAWKNPPLAASQKQKTCRRKKRLSRIPPYPARRCAREALSPYWRSSQSHLWLMAMVESPRVRFRLSILKDARGPAPRSRFAPARELVFLALPLQASSSMQGSLRPQRIR